MNITNETNEEKEYNDIESLAAYLHSEKMQRFKAEEERVEKGLPPEPEKTPDEKIIDDVLFTHSDIKSRQNRPEYINSAKKDRSDGNPVRSSPKSADPSIPANPLVRKNTGADVARRESPKLRSHPDTAKQKKDVVKTDNTSFAEKAKKKFDSLISAAGKKINDIKRNISKPSGNEKRVNREITANSSSGEVRDEIPALAASLSEALGEKAAEITSENRNALPPEDIPEVFDITEGSTEEENFDKTATRLMNAVNDPHERSVSMKESVDAEEEEERAERIRTAHILKNYERQKQSTRTLAYILISFLLCAGILGASAFASSYLVKWALDFTGVASTEFEIDVTIPEDATIETVAAILSENNIINDPKFFKAYADFTDKIKNDSKKSGKEFIPGKYTVSSNMTYSTLLSILQTRNVPRKTVSVRIIEGMTAYEIGELLEENNICFADDFRKYYKNILNIYDFERRVKENSLKFNQLEGYLFPDTYEFYVINAMENGVKPTGDETPEEAYNKMKEESEENAKEAAKKMYANFNSKMTRAMYKKMGEMHLTLDETIALASIVQKEAADTEDMGKVASVFLNRIRNSAEFPFLQSDVTVLYVENDIKPFIEGTSAAKNRIYNAYNTYVCRGIPSGAVCNPGIDAINAVIDAPDTPYLYFCANKETGEIYYAQTHEEHEQNLILAGLTVGDSGEDSGLPIGEGGEIE